MNWYKVLKTAKVEIGHGNTLEGQMMKKEMERVAKEVDKLRTVAATGGPHGVLPRWRGDIRQQILKLPSLAALARMSMMEIEQVSKDLDGIQQSMKRYSASRMKEIMGDGNSSGNWVS